MITAASRHAVMIEATKLVPQELLDAAAALLPREPSMLIGEAIVAQWLDSAYASLTLAAQGIERVELIPYLKDRLCTHLAAEAARAGAAASEVTRLLWPDDRHRSARLAAASTNEVATLWPALKEYLEAQLQKSPWNGIVEIYSSDVARVASVQPDPPEFRSYFQFLASMAYDKLDDRFSDAIDCGEKAEPGWVETTLLALLPPAGAFAYVSMFHADRERLLALVEHPASAIASAALMRLEESARYGDQLERRARDLRYMLATGRSSDTAAVDEIVRAHSDLAADDAAFQARTFEVVARHASRFGHRLASLAVIGPHREAALAALRSIGSADLDCVARAELARARATDDWSAVVALADVAEDSNRPLYDDLVTEHEGAWRADTSRDGVHLPLLRVGLLIDAFRTKALLDPLAFRAKLNADATALLRRLSGRFLGLHIALIDEVLAQFYVVGQLSKQARAGFGVPDLVETLHRLAELVRRWRGLHCKLLDSVSTTLLSSIDSKDLAQVDAGCELLRAASENEVLRHIWASWIPEEEGVRTLGEHPKPASRGHLKTGQS